MTRPYFYAIFLAIGFQIWLIGSLVWMLYWRRRSRANALTGWQAGPTALAPMILLLMVCAVGMVRMALHLLE